MVWIMGSTPRQRTTQIPMPTRSSEAGSDCEGRTYLSYLRADEERPASFFILGDVLHRTIEQVIAEGLDLADGLGFLEWLLGLELAEIPDGAIVVEGSSRSMESIFEDGERMLTNWFAHVHPDSDNRHPFYDNYVWPPKTEVTFYRTDLGTRDPVWGSVDAVFDARVAGMRPAIVDWKSGVKRPPSQFQLDYYRFGTGMTEAKAAYHMLDRIRKSSIVVEAEDYPGDTYIREAISSTERTKRSVVAGQMPKFSPGWQCGYCTVQHLCPVDGDPRKRKKNEREFKKLLAQAEAMKEITGA